MKKSCRTQTFFSFSPFLAFLAASSPVSFLISDSNASQLVVYCILASFLFFPTIHVLWFRVSKTQACKRSQQLCMWRLQVICVVLRHAVVAFYGNASTEENVSQWVCFSHMLLQAPSHFFCGSLVTHFLHSTVCQSYDGTNATEPGKINWYVNRNSRANRRVPFMCLWGFVVNVKHSHVFFFVLFNRELIFWVHRLEPVWVIQVGSNNTSVKEHINQIARLEQNLNAIFNPERLSSHLWDKSTVVPHWGLRSQRKGDCSCNVHLSSSSTFPQVTVALISFLETMLITYLSYKVGKWLLESILSRCNPCHFLVAVTCSWLFFFLRGPLASTIHS